MQQYYYVPRSLLAASNTLVLIEVGDAMRRWDTCIIYLLQELGVTDLSQVTVALSSVQVPAN